MGKAAKVSFFIAVLVLVASFAIQIMAGSWMNLNTIMVGSSVGLVVLAAIFDRRLYWEFFTMRTTKYGMNMGVTILMAVAVLICVNYFANSYNKTWDLTNEKSNSLAEQSTRILKDLKEDVEIKVFTRGPSAAEDKHKIKQSLSLYLESSPHIQARFINPYVDGALAMEYLNPLPDRDQATSFMFVEKGAKRIRVDQPFDEATITAALIKLTRSSSAKVYFAKGHGERDVEGDSDQSLNAFVDALKESSYQVETLNMLDTKEIPKDAAVLAIVGPSSPYLDSELSVIRDFLKQGGRLFLALDPGQRHNLANLTKSVGIEFKNNYVITTVPVNGGGPAMILGRIFDVSNSITNSFPAGSSYSLFYLASEVQSAQDKVSSIQTSPVVSTDTTAFTMNDLKTVLKEKPKTKPVTLGISSSGTMTDEKDQKAFEAVVFGDSDFMSNRSLIVGVNRDLAMNAFAKLANQSDLISIRPKLPKGTMVFLTTTTRLVMILVTLAIPVFLLMTAGIVWFRRRGA